MCLYGSLQMCAYVSVCLHVSMVLCRGVCVCLCVCLCFCHSVCIVLCRIMYVSACLYVCMSVFLSLCLHGSPQRYFLYWLAFAKDGIICCLRYTICLLGIFNTFVCICRLFSQFNFLLSFLIWVQTDCIGYQQTTYVAASRESIKRTCATIHWG